MQQDARRGGWLAWGGGGGGVCVWGGMGSGVDCLTLSSVVVAGKAVAQAFGDGDACLARACGPMRYCGPGTAHFHDGVRLEYCDGNALVVCCDCNSM